MPCRFALPAAFAALLIVSLRAACPQEQSKTITVTAPAVPTDYSKEGVVYDQVATVLKFQADGTAEKTLTVEARIQSENAVHEVGLVNFIYAAGNDRLEVVYLRVRKLDGTVIDTPATDQQDMPTEVTRQAPFYSDIREVQIPVKSLSAGDKLEYQIRWITQKPMAPGQFWGAINFVTSNVVLAETVELSYPADKYVLVLSPKNKPTISDENGRRIYRWKSSQLKLASADKKEAPNADDMPAITWTTYRSWQEIGEWFGSLARERAVVSPEIQTKAQQLIAGKTTDDDKIQAIYNYVSTQVRYIGIAFGIGRYQPHSAETVLDNRYGDCKDKHTLLAALLKAAGYDAWPALIGSSHKLQADLPSPAQFDHVITVVSLHNNLIWLDSTPEVTPYRMLLAPLRDKQALVIPTSGKSELMRTPSESPFPFVDTYTATGKLDSQGTLDAHLHFEMRGDNEAVFRSIFHSASRAQWQQMAQNISQNMGFAGTVSNLDISLPERTDQPFHYAYDYNHKEYADWANRRILPLAFAVSLPAPGDDPAAKPIELGSPHVETYHSVIELPSNYTARLPHSVKYTTPFAMYQADYKLDGNKFITERKLQILEHEVPVEQAGEFTKFSKNVTEDESQYIQLTTTGSSAVDATVDDPKAQEYMKSAAADMSRYDLKAARNDLQSAEKISPHQRSLWVEYAYLDSRDNHLDDSIADLRKELQYHPDNVMAYRMLAEIQMHSKHTDQAQQTLRDLLKVVPGDSLTEARLGELLLEDKHYDEASTLLEAAMRQSPSDGNLAVQTGRAELLAGKRDAGVVTLRGILNGASDANVLNNAAYELADASVELPTAETSCKKALEILEKQTAQINLGNLTKDDLAQMRLLTATWDTMGWIYFREGNLTLAEDYVSAAWKATQNKDGADHLRQIYEKQGRRQEAARIAGLDLQKERTITLPTLAKTGSADFYLLLSAYKVEDVQFVTGDDRLRSALPLLRKANFSGQVPKNSQSRLLRRGIVFCSDAAHMCQFTLIPPEAVTLN